MKHYPCNNQRCPNKWHYTVECPRAVQTSGPQQTNGDFNPNEPVKMAGADKYADLRLNIRDAFGEVLDGTVAQVSMVGNWLDYGHRYPTRVGLVRRTTGLLYLVTSRTVKIGWNLGRGAGRAVNSFFHTPAEQYNQTHEGSEFSGAYDPETGNAEFHFTQPIDEEDAVDPESIQEEEAAFRSDPKTPTVDELVYNLYLKNFSEDSARKSLRSEGYDEKTVDQAVQYISAFKAQYEEMKRRAYDDPRNSQGAFEM